MQTKLYEGACRVCVFDNSLFSSLLFETEDFFSPLKDFFSRLHKSLTKDKNFYFFRLSVKLFAEQTTQHMVNEVLVNLCNT